MTQTQAYNAEPYVVGLCLALVVASAVPQIATGTVWVSVALLLVTWTSVYAMQGSFNV